MAEVMAEESIAVHFDRKNKRWREIRTLRASETLAEALAQLLNVPLTDHLEDEVMTYLNEVREDKFLRERIERIREDESRRIYVGTFEYKTSGVSLAGILFLYILTRFLKPLTALETGCASGWSSALMLSAMERNGQGKLYSIDLPPVAGRYNMKWTMPEDLGSGFLIPDHLRSRWQLIQGNSGEELLPLLKKLGQVDFFYHDSDHTYSHMMWEYLTVWPYLKTGGVLVSDDIGFNCSFWDFAVSQKKEIAIYRENLNFGAILKDN